MIPTCGQQIVRFVGKEWVNSWLDNPFYRPIGRRDFPGDCFDCRRRDAELAEPFVRARPHRGHFHDGAVDQIQTIARLRGEPAEAL